MDVFILGAGFSKAINANMPTMKDLSEEVIEKLKSISEMEGSHISIPSTLVHFGYDIERWITYLSQQQPWLSEEHHHRNVALARDMRGYIREAIVRRKSLAMHSPLPEWLNTLVRQWHTRRVTVITLNYDTLVESTARELETENSSRILPEQMYPPYFANIASRSGTGLWGEGNLDTFSYYKLHGSTNWYYSGRDNFYGETIFYSDVPPWETKYSREEFGPHPRAEDKEWLIIPPVTDKLTYFNNETIRRLWQKASNDLRSATRVFVIGYSLPPSDLGMQFFLQHSQPSEETQAEMYIVDPDHGAVSRYQELLPKLNVMDDFAGREGVVEDFVDFYYSSS